MTVETAYQFLKPSLEQLTPEEKEELRRLIGGQDLKPKKKKKDPVMSKDQMKIRLLKNHLK